MPKVIVSFSPAEMTDILIQARSACYYWAQTDKHFDVGKTVAVCERDDSGEADVPGNAKKLGTLRVSRFHYTSVEVDTVAHPHRVALLLRGDAESADAVIQLLVLGDIRYG